MQDPTPTADNDTLEALTRVLATADDTVDSRYCRHVAGVVLASGWLDDVRQRERERVAQAIEAQGEIAANCRDVTETPVVKNNFDQQAWAYGDAARIARTAS